MTRFYPRAGGVFRRIPPAPTRVGRARLLIACAICPTEFTATAAQLAGRGKRCPGCGTLHTDEGTFDPQDQPTVLEPNTTPTRGR